MFTEDLHIFLQDFGEKIIFTLPDGSIIDKDPNNNDLLGILDLTHTDSTLGYQTVKNTRPRLTCVEADVTNVIKNSTVTVGQNKVYKVFDISPDGTGFAIIELGR